MTSPYCYATDANVRPCITNWFQEPTGPSALFIITRVKGKHFLRVKNVATKLTKSRNKIERHPWLIRVVNEVPEERQKGRWKEVDEMTLPEIIRLIEAEKEKGYSLEEIIELLKRIADKS